MSSYDYPEVDVKIRDYTKPIDSTLPKVSTIITSYNRFDGLVQAIKSVKNQTYKNIEIIIVNDCSTDKTYYEYNEIFEGCKILDVQKNSKELFGFPCPGGWQRHIGMKYITGEYIAFLDDDDFWFPRKIERQIKEMSEQKYMISCTSGVKGKDYYKDGVEYQKFFDEGYLSVLFNLLKIKEIPKEITAELLLFQNFIICCSVVIHKSILENIGSFPILNDGDDYEYWIRITARYECLFLNEPLIYYNIGEPKNYNKNQWYVFVQTVVRGFLKRKMPMPLWQLLISKPSHLPDYIYYEGTTININMSKILKEQQI